MLHWPRCVFFLSLVLASGVLHYQITLAQTDPPADVARPFNPNFIIDDNELTDSQSMSVEAIQRFLTGAGGVLARYTTIDIDGSPRDAASIIWRAAQTYGINPKFILTLLQKEQSLVENRSPSLRDYDWATGYAICDSCSTDDPTLQQFKGFAIQVDRAAWRQRYYLSHPTEFGVRVGQAVLIDGTLVTPTTQATTNLYIYTPHLHGNQNFWSIWNRYFARHYPDGSLLQEKGIGNVWLLNDGRLRLISSPTVLLTDFDPRKIIQVSTADILRYDIGLPIKFPNYSLLRSPRGTVYLLVDEVRRGLASREVFRALGFNPAEVIDASWTDLNAYPEGTPIVSTGVPPLGQLLQDPTTGGVFYVADGKRHPLWSREILKDRFPRYVIERATPATLMNLVEGEPVKFRNGDLVTAPNDPTVYVISRGAKRPISSADIFRRLGYQWSNVITTTPEALGIHPDGPPITG